MPRRLPSHAACSITHYKKAPMPPLLCFSLSSKNKRKWACCFVGEGKEAPETWGERAMNYSA